MALRFYNTLTRQDEEFAPLRAGEVRLYTCGPTVYDYAHIGNFRTYLWEDLLRRYLQYRGYRVTQAMNLTDVDDKTIANAREAGLTLEDYTRTYIDAFFEDVETLGIEKAEHYPRAPAYIPQMALLGETFDIHTGGVDNVFPHHENEIAQSEAATGKPFVRTWMHAAHLIVDGEKMSKSKGNFFTLRELAARGHDMRAIRYMLLSVHYRKPLNFTFEGLTQAVAALGRIDDLALRLDALGPRP